MGVQYVSVNAFSETNVGLNLLTGVAFVGLGLFVDGIMGANNGAPASLNLGENITSMQQILNNSALERYSRTSWSERVE